MLYTRAGTGHGAYTKVNELHLMLKAWGERVSTGASLSETDLKKNYPVRVYTHYQKNYALEKKPTRWVLNGPSSDKKLEKSRKQADEARGKIIRMQSMLNRIERFELGEADFRDTSGDFLRDRDIFVDSEDRDLFQKACPIAFDRIETREREVEQEAKKSLAQETSELLLKKLNNKLMQRGAPVPSTSLTASSVAAEAESQEPVTIETRQQLMRILDDRKAYMIESLQMEIAFMIHQHKIVDDYQSPVNGSMYSESLHRCVIVHCSLLTIPPPPTRYPSSYDPHSNAPRLQSSCASSRRSFSARTRSRDSRTPSISCFF